MWRKINTIVKKKNYKVELSKETVLNIVNKKYNALLVQICKDGIDKPITKDFYNKYKSNPEDKFSFNRSLMKDLNQKWGVGGFEEYI